MLDVARRESIRADVSAIRSEACRLRDSIVHIPTGALLTTVLNTLSDVDTVFLASSEDRTTTQEAWWLAWAERWLQVAFGELQTVTAQINQYGGPEKVQTIR